MDSCHNSTRACMRAHLMYIMQITELCIILALPSSLRVSCTQKVHGKALSLLLCHCFPLLKCFLFSNRNVHCETYDVKDTTIWILDFPFCAATEEDTYEVKYACSIYTNNKAITPDHITNAARLAVATIGINDAIVVPSRSSAMRIFFTMHILQTTHQRPFPLTFRLQLYCLHHALVQNMERTNDEGTNVWASLFSIKLPNTYSLALADRKFGAPDFVYVLVSGIPNKQFTKMYVDKCSRREGDRALAFSEILNIHSNSTRT